MSQVNGKNKLNETALVKDAWEQEQERNQELSRLARLKAICVEHANYYRLTNGAPLPNQKQKGLSV